jgi:predicted HD superfamily hydrolase involved in NAD metabolism
MLLSDKAKALVIEKYKDSHKHRLAHIFGVAEMEEYLAIKYGVDKEKALVAAYMHAYSKYDDPKEAIGILKDEEIKECESYPFLYHAYLSAENYNKLLGNDLDIYNAIKYHVFGRENMSILEAIIMIADYTEKNMTYPSCIECRKIIVEDNVLNLTIYKSLEGMIEFAEREGLKLHPEQVLVLEEYKRKVEEDVARRNNR